MKAIIMLLIAAFVTQATSAQTNKSKSTTAKATTAAQVQYTCEMHPEVESNKPGKCPQCGMALTRVKTYTCSMHPEVVSNKPGKCPKCDMELTEVKAKTKSGKS